MLCTRQFLLDARRPRKGDRTVRASPHQDGAERTAPGFRQPAGGEGPASSFPAGSHSVWLSSPLRPPPLSI